MCFEIRKAAFKAQVCPLPAVWPWVSCLTGLCQRFFNYKMSISHRFGGGFTVNMYLYAKCVPGLGGYSRNASPFLLWGVEVQRV